MTKARTLANFDSSGVLTSTSSLDASLLTGALPALNGSALTNLTAGGKVLQVVHFRKTDEVTKNAAGGDGDVHSGVTITPTLATSKILVIASAHLSMAGGVSHHADITLKRNDITIGIMADDVGYQELTYNNKTISINVLDTPATTYAVTYSIHHANASGTSNYDYEEGNYTLMEIAA
jgi:hypothetical protein